MGRAALICATLLALVAAGFSPRSPVFWTCPVFVPPQVLVWAIFRSTARDYPEFCTLAPLSGHGEAVFGEHPQTCAACAKQNPPAIISTRRARPKGVNPALL